MPNQTRYILDTSSLLRYPEILAWSQSKRLIIPESIRYEMSGIKNPMLKEATEALLQKGIQTGLKIVKIPDVIQKELYPSDKNIPKLGNADIDLARIAIGYAEEGGERSVCVVTEDKLLAELLESRSIPVISGAAFIHVSSQDPQNLEIQTSANRLVSIQWKKFSSGVAFGVIASIVASLTYSHLQLIIKTISVWGTVALVPIVGVGLYWLRQRYRLGYGVFELIVGLVMAYRVFFPDFNYSALRFSEGIQLLGGLYVMVRGLDNIGKGVEETRYEIYWRKVFPY